jgi:hypothetical protein
MLDFIKNPIEITVFKDKHKENKENQRLKFKKPQLIFLTGKRTIKKDEKN